jgi:cysteine desulfurase / selenocysteine lyase
LARSSVDVHDPEDSQGTNIAWLRSLFPVTRDAVYLNHALVAPLPVTVTAAVQAFLHDQQYAIGTKDEWDAAVDGVRGKIAALIGGSAAEIAFTKNTTESIALIAGGLNLRPGKNVVLTNTQHPANLYPWLALKRHGIEVRMVPAPAGAASVEAFAALVNDRTRVVAVDHVNNRYGFRQDLRGLGQLCRRSGALLVVNATQSAGAMPIDVADANIGVLAFTCFKWLVSPYGLACLYCRKDVLDGIAPAEVGDRSGRAVGSAAELQVELHDSAKRFESGNLNYPAIFGLRAALDLVLGVGVEWISGRVLSLSGLLIDELSASGLTVVRPRQDANLSGIVTIRIDRSRELAAKLRDRKVHVSAFDGLLRISPHFYNTEDDLASLRHHLRELIER